MKHLLLVMTTLLLMSCAGTTLPVFPDIKYQYMIDVRDEFVADEILLSSIVNVEDIEPLATQARCLKFIIVSKTPYKIKFVSEVPLIECNLVGGFKPKDTTHLLNWIDDVTKWAKKRSQCFTK